MRSKVSIVITARNYSQYLKEAIESALNQTIKCQVIYSDDFSGDISVKIAESYKSVTVVTGKKHDGVVKARNRGAEYAKGKYLIFLDGDDILPKDYVETCLNAIDDNTPFVYSSAQNFGMSNSHYWRTEPWEMRNIFTQNFCNTSMLIHRKVFKKAGRWQDTPHNTMWDWDLAIRMSRYGTPKRSTAILYYRSHTEQWSKNLENGFDKEKSMKWRKDAMVTLRRKNTRLTIGLVYSGRLPELLPEWFDSLTKEIKNIPYKEIIIINNSKKEFPLKLNNKRSKFGKYFDKVTILKDDWKLRYNNERQRRQEISSFMSRSCSTILEQSTGDIIHFREDDIIPPSGGFLKMYSALVDTRNIEKTAVAGVYQNRHGGREQLIGGWWNGTDKKRTTDTYYLPDKEFVEIDFCGTGMLLFWKHNCPNYFPAQVNGINAHDWAWCEKHRSNDNKVYVMPEVMCKHYIDSKKFLLPRGRLRGGDHFIKEKGARMNKSVSDKPFVIKK